MQSFIDSPELHRLASQNPKLAGGQFLNLEQKHVQDVKEIIRNVQKEAAVLLTLSEEITILDDILQTEGDGKSLEFLYEQIPASLRGCVELVYDQNNHPVIRFFEEILYEKYYNKQLQSVMFSQLETDERHFVLSTPRIPRLQEMELPLSMDSALLTRICRSRTEGILLGEMRGQLNLTDEQLTQFSTFFDHKPPNIFSHVCSLTDTNVRLRYFGHACVLLETSTFSILLDPLISFFQPQAGIERFTLDDLPEHIDYVLFTHNHLDHVVFETLLFLKHKVGQFIFQKSMGGKLLNPNFELMLKHLGFMNMRSIDYMEEVNLQCGLMFSYPFLGEHGDLDIQSKSAFFIQIHGKKFLFAADSNNLDNALYEYLRKKMGDIPVVFIGMECVGGPLDWIYGPLLSPKIKRAHKLERRYSGSDSAKALALVQALGATDVFVYAMGQEPWLSHITSLNYSNTSPQLIECDKFIAVCAEKKINASCLFGKKEWVL